MLWSRQAAATKDQKRRADQRGVFVSAQRDNLNPAIMPHDLSKQVISC
jgi:hypothetical protein